VEVGRNASSERANTVDTAIPLWWSFGVRLFVADEQHPKGDVLVFERRHDDCLRFVSQQSGLE
jgi:hypothetical protein